jgi:hypothetical protein
MKQSSKKTANKLPPETDNHCLSGKECSPKIFVSLFLKKISTKCYPESIIKSNIHGISVSHDNLVWVNQSKRCVHLLNSSGEVLRTIHLDYDPVFNCCTPSGDLLVTQGCAAGNKPIITIITRDGKSRVLADLSPHATSLYGILCEKEDIYVAAEGDRFPYTHFIMKLNMRGEIERVYNIENDCFINQVISLNGQIIGLGSRDTVMMSLKGEVISAKKVNIVGIKCVYSASASVDNLGNVILALDSKLFTIHPNLKIMHRIDAGVGPIISTAVDKNNQLWLGTASGELYSAHYLK